MIAAGGAAGWRLLVTPAATGAWNMAVDECLMESVRDGGAPTLRFYRWAPACISFGRNQPAREVYAPLCGSRPDLDFVRRPTGGRAVLHDVELTYSVALPARLLGGARAAYRLVNEALLAGIALLGVGATMEADTSRRPPVPSTAPCFADPVAGELLHDGRKLVGSAQVHRDGVLLQHGSILIDRSPLAAVVEAATGVALGAGAAYLADSPASFATADDLADAIARAWRAQVGPLAGSALTSQEEARIARLVDRYADPDWTWRR